MKRADLINEEIIHLISDIEDSSRRLDVDKRVLLRLVADVHATCIIAAQTAEGELPEGEKSVVDGYDWRDFLAGLTSYKTCPICNSKPWEIPQSSPPEQAEEAPDAPTT